MKLRKFNSGTKDFRENYQKDKYELKPPLLLYKYVQILITYRMRKMFKVLCYNVICMSDRMKINQTRWNWSTYNYFKQRRSYHRFRYIPKLPI